MNLEEARKIIATDEADAAVALEAVAVVLRFHGMATPGFLPIASAIEQVAKELRETK